jgi:hypothetical protein
LAAHNSRDWVLNPRTCKELAPFGKVIGIPLLLLSVALAIADGGWFKRCFWAWRLAVTIVAAEILGNFASVFLGHIVDGAIGFTDFSEAEGFIGRLWTLPIIRALYAGFHLATGLRATRLPNFRRQLQAHGFRCQLEQKALGGFLCSSLWRNKIPEDRRASAAVCERSEEFADRAM